VGRDVVYPSEQEAGIHLLFVPEPKGISLETVTGHEEGRGGGHGD
jgi:hypothetical protein